MHTNLRNKFRPSTVNKHSLFFYPTLFFMHRMKRKKHKMHANDGWSSKYTFLNEFLSVFLSLQTSFNLPQAVSYDPYSPRITLDSKKVVQAEAFVLTLKNYLTELLKQPVEARIPKLMAGEYASTFISWRLHPVPLHNKSKWSKYPILFQTLILAHLQQVSGLNTWRGKSRKPIKTNTPTGAVI